MNCRLRLIAALCMLVPLSTLSARSSAFQDGERLFRENKFSEAIVKLEQAATEPGADPMLYNYLGICYHETGQFQKALDAYDRGVNTPGSNKKLLYYNSGNALFMMGKFSEAEEFYTLAVSADTQYAPAFLNRGNARVRQDNLPGASSDYERYLDLVPDSPQRDKIVSAQAVIVSELENREKEKRRIALEEALIQAEQQRIAQEKERIAAEERRQVEIKAAAEAAAAAAREAERAAAAKAEAERRQKMLDDIAASLQSSDASTNLSAGTEGVLEYEYESELE